MQRKGNQPERVARYSGFSAVGRPTLSCGQRSLRSRSGSRLAANQQPEHVRTAFACLSLSVVAQPS